MKTLTNTSRIVIARSYGQLGNRLFLYAHFIAAAREYGVTVSNPCFAEYANLFPATNDDLWCRYPCVNANLVDANLDVPSARRRRWLSKAAYLTARAIGISGLGKSRCEVLRLRGDEECDLGGDVFANLLATGRTILADGWLFRSETLLQKHSDAIRNHFQIQPEHRQKVNQTIAKIRQSADVVVGVHIRHGDYATYLGGKYFYPVAQYAEIMRKVAVQFPAQRVAFMVCSNAKIHPNDFDGLNVHYGPGHLVEDMYSFAETNLIVGPPSTYTSWASFYGNVPLIVVKQSDQDIDVAAIMIQQRQAA
ncbi:MAG: hypothetical protein WBD20_18605 [Pirellulaceae bacterium]